MNEADASSAGPRSSLVPTPCRGRVQYHDEASRHAQILIDADGIAGNRIDPPYHWVDVALFDARRDPPSWQDDRLQFVEMPPTELVTGLATGLATDRFDALRDSYEIQLRGLLRTTLDATEVVVFDHTHRGPGAHARPPSHHVHCDYNAWSARTRLAALLGPATAEHWARGRFAVVNVWRPLSSPVQRDPIGFVRPRSVNPQDWLDVDIVFPDRRGQVRGLRHDPDHQWVYLPDMRTCDAAIFGTFVSEGIDGVAHAAVELRDGSGDAPARRSIESRAFVRWA